MKPFFGDPNRAHFDGYTYWKSIQSTHVLNSCLFIFTTVQLILGLIPRDTGLTSTDFGLSAHLRPDAEDNLALSEIALVNHYM